MSTLRTLLNPQSYMKRTLSKIAPSPTIPKGLAKAILRGGTFHRVQVLCPQGATYIEHCGLNYTVTHQKDANGRIICVWSKS